MTLVDQPTAAILLVVVAEGLSTDQDEFAPLFEWLGTRDGTRGRSIIGGTVLLSGPSSLPSIAADPTDVIAKVATLDALEGRGHRPGVAVQRGAGVELPALAGASGPREAAGGGRGERHADPRRVGDDRPPPMYATAAASC